MFIGVGPNKPLAGIELKRSVRLIGVRATGLEKPTDTD